MNLKIYRTNPNGMKLVHLRGNDDSLV